MKILRILCWLLAATPALAAFAWVALAARLPEPILQRHAAGGSAPQWEFGALATFDAEPACLLSRLSQLLLLQLPGVSLANTAVCNAVLALVLVVALCLLVRRAAGTRGVLTAVALFGAGLLACSPEYGANWLHGERLGRFAVPAVFAMALLAASAGRARCGLVVLLLAAAAPLFHDRGVVVFLALLPAFAARSWAWILALLLVGNIAAAYVMGPLPSIGVAGSGVLGGMMQSPLATLDELLRVTGSMWPDILPASRIDERILGGVSWCLPVLAAARRRCRGPWWSCVAFGLLSALWHLERRGAVSPQELVELSYGGFLLPIGATGLLAAQRGRLVWAVAGAMLLVPVLQGWWHGLDELRLARARVDRVDAAMVMPADVGGLRDQRQLPTRDIWELLRLEDRGWVPAESDSWNGRIAAAIDLAPDPAQGTFVGGTMTALRGTVRTGLFGPQVHCVLVGATLDGTLIAFSLVLPEAHDPTAASVPWQASIDAPIPPGARIRAIGLDVRTGGSFRLGPTFVLENGDLLEVDG